MAQNLSFNASDDMAQGKLLKAMCPDSEIASKFGCARTKATYLCKLAWCPFLTKIQEQCLSECFFSVIIDETTTAAVKRQFDIQVRYFLDSTSEVKCEHLRSVFISNGTADTMKAAFLDTFAELDIPMTNIITLSTDELGTGRITHGTVYNTIINITEQDPSTRSALIGSFTQVITLLLFSWYADRGRVATVSKQAYTRQLSV